MQPIIGITMCLDKAGLIRPGINYSYIRSEYGQQVRRAGGQPVFLDTTIDPAAAARMCHGIVIGGGEDIEPSLYGQQPTSIRKGEPMERTLWERQLIVECDNQERPILGICYGAQVLNVHYGGTLYQDIKTEHGSQLDHGKSTAPAVHNVTFEQDFLGYKAGSVTPTVSRHHQAVRDMAPGFSVVARADDGVIEAIAARGRYGIQWHAESDDTAEVLYREFVKTCVTGQTIRTASGDSILETM